MKTRFFCKFSIPYISSSSKIIDNVMFRKSVPIQIILMEWNFNLNNKINFSIWLWFKLGFQHFSEKIYCQPCYFKIVAEKTMYQKSWLCLQNKDN